MSDSYLPASRIPASGGFTLTAAQHKHTNREYAAIIIRASTAYRLRCTGCNAESEPFIIRRASDEPDRVLPLRADDEPLGDPPDH